MPKTHPLVTFASLVLAAALLAAAAILATSSPAATPPCTHGVSSAGPAVIVDGKLVSNPKPHTEACLP